jgi:hypothetical protein
MLLESGVTVNIQGKHITHSFFCAAQHFLIPAGKYGTALQAASYMEHFNIVKLLLESSADPNIYGQHPV